MNLQKYRKLRNPGNERNRNVGAGGWEEAGVASPPVGQSTWINVNSPKSQDIHKFTEETGNTFTRVLVATEIPWSPFTDNKLCILFKQIGQPMINGNWIENIIEKILFPGRNWGSTIFPNAHDLKLQKMWQNYVNCYISSQNYSYKSWLVTDF